jgi:tRNA 2-selenouridine synthase
MREPVEISAILKDIGRWQIIDVRSPCEFSSGHIPGAINIPLFSDEERARVGTLYKQTSPEAAMKEGLKISGSKMNQYIDAIKPYRTGAEKKMVIHCWRGGKRSEAMHWLFNFSGVDAARLHGGYKSFRNALQTYFADNIFDFRILGGYTGSGKTEILKKLALRGQQVIDLEKIARHKGSAFGSIGEEEQPTNEQFENDLFTAFLSMDLAKTIWLENESRNIGKVYLPESLWIKMRSSTLYNIEVDREARLDRALAYYSGPGDVEKLKMSFNKIKKRLGGLEFQNAMKALEEDDMRTAASIALKYYDKSYTFQLQNWNEEKVIHLHQCENVAETAERLISSGNI